MILDTVTRGMKALLNGNEITIYERTVLESMLDQANRRGNLTEKQVRFYNSIASNYTENALMEKREWEAGFVDKKLDDLMIIARYYKAQGSYFLALVEKILSDDNYIPNKSQYHKLCENKYAQKVLTEHYKEPKFEVGQQVYLVSKAPPPYAMRQTFKRGGIILRANAEPIENSCKGAKKYLVLPIGDPHGVVIEERWLKSRRGRKARENLEESHHKGFSFSFCLQLDMIKRHQARNRLQLPWTTF